MISCNAALIFEFDAAHSLQPPELGSSPRAISSATVTAAVAVSGCCFAGLGIGHGPSCSDNGAKLGGIFRWVVVVCGLLRDVDAAARS